MADQDAQRNREIITFSPSAVVQTVRSRQTYAAILYTLVSAPLGALYLLLLLVGLVGDILQLAARTLATILGQVVHSRIFRFLFHIALRIVLILAIAFFIPIGLFINIGLVLYYFLRTVWYFYVNRNNFRRLPWRAAFQEQVRADPPPLPSTARMRRSVERFLDRSTTPVRWMQARVEPEQWILLPVLWQRFYQWERRRAEGWLGVTIPPLNNALGTDESLGNLPPKASLLYFVLMLLLGAWAALFAYGAAWMVSQLLYYSIYGPFHWLTTSTPLVLDAGVSLYDLMGLTLLLVPVLYLLYLPASYSLRFAPRLLAPDDTAQRLREAEAVAMQARARAEEADKRRQELVVNVSHELRTPISNIRGHVESLLWTLDSADGQTLSPEAMRPYLSIVYHEAERLGALVEELLAVARADRGELQLSLEAVNAAEVVEEVYRALEPLARRERQVTVVQQVEPDLAPVQADRRRLAQVLLNLLRNAVTYTPQGGIVAVSLRQDDAHHLCITVEDTGIGIAPEELEKIWDRFYRTDASRARSSGGFGLGLAIARDLISAMGGSITVQSKVGEGSSFGIRLPIADDTRSAS